MAYEPWQPGMVLTANRLASISPTWRAWTPTWTTSSGNFLPSFGDAAIDCSYAESADTVFWQMEIIFGASTNFGGGGSSDNWLFSLPVPAAGIPSCIGFFELNATIDMRVVGRGRCFTTGDVSIEISSGRVDGTAVAGGGIADAASPWSWASGYSIRGSGQYQRG
ncbi:hypothetical protein [Streptomyces sp. M92]|uniref:hypothetical protein n=1 Tax=Streptomyces sp. M92 TaxID=2944250 RepID=UPI0023498B73|nr:hypothetical protein [Streptomyces sp. M92]WCN06074.1 hypothetical protein M6G08_30530 [Streptomyces sp. M92]